MENLAAARDRMEDKLPFWPDQWSNELKNGAKVIMVPPTAKMPQVLEFDLAEGLHWMINIGAEAEVMIKETCSGPITGAEVTLVIDKDAKVTYIADELDQRGGMETGVVTREAVLAAGAEIDWYGAMIGQTGYRTKVKSILRGEAARSDMHWLHLAQGDERTELELVNCFDAPNCRGQIFVKAAAQDRANVKVTGGIEITLEGGGTDSYLKEDTLLLDPEARVRALPCLEIKTNDVKAGHGATVTNFTAEDLFYLQSRGIEAQLARSLMIQGFLESVLDECSDTEFLKKVQSKIV